MAEKYSETLTTNRALTKRIANLEAKLAAAEKSAGRARRKRDDVMNSTKENILVPNDK